MTESKRITRKLSKKWQYTQGDIKIDDKIFHVNFYGKSTIDLAQIQLNMGFKTMTKWELFKHLCWRIWRNR
jgi:hypothetical protein